MVTLEKEFYFMQMEPQGMGFPEVTRQGRLLVLGILGILSLCFLILLSRSDLDKHTFFLWSEA